MFLRRAPAIVWTLVLGSFVLVSPASAGGAANGLVPNGRAVGETDPRITRREAQADAALRAGRTAEALGHWATILRLDRDHPVGARLRAEAPASPPLDSPPLAAAQKHLPRGFRRITTANFVILTDGDPSEVRAIERTLEDTRRAFKAFSARLELDPMPLRHRLVCVVFDRHREFARFGREQDQVHATWCHGYYTPRYDRVVLYLHGPDDTDDPFAVRRRTVAAVHETVHQLAYHCLVQNAAVQYPIWLSEGLATSFETDDTTRRFGPSEPFEARERRLADVLARGDLESLNAFVGRTSVGNADPDTIESVYSQSYALFCWLMSTKPGGVRMLLDDLHRQPPGRVPATRQRELFESAFGSPASLQRSWDLHVRDRVRRLGSTWPAAPAYAESPAHRRPGTDDPRGVQRVHATARPTLPGPPPRPIPIGLDLADDPDCTDANVLAPSPATADNLAAGPADADTDTNADADADADTDTDADTDAEADAGTPPRATAAAAATSPAAAPAPEHRP
ncbi:MAG: DUF1570 domain-containing protein [Phycisphaerales bacterium]